MSDFNRNTEKKYSGMDKDIQQKIGSRWNADDAKRVLVRGTRATSIRSHTSPFSSLPHPIPFAFYALPQAWISELSEMQLDSDFHAALKSGVALCKALNKLSPGACPKISTFNQPFMQRENIAAFIQGAKKYGVKDTIVFNTQDLFEGDNLVSVVDCIFALGGVAQANGWKGKALGVAQTSGGIKDSKFEVKPTGDEHSSTYDTSGTVNRNAEGAKDEHFKTYYRPTH